MTVTVTFLIHLPGSTKMAVDAADGTTPVRISDEARNLAAFSGPT